MYIDYGYRQKDSFIKKLGKWTWKTSVNLGRDFCLRTTIHGFQHIAQPGRYWFERLLWFGLTMVAIIGAVGVTRDQWQRYNENPTVVTLEKNFRTWQYSVPAITACIENRVDPGKLPLVIKKYWNVSPEDGRYQYYSRFINVVANSDLLHLEGYNEFKDDVQLDVDLHQVAVDVMPEVQIKTIVSEDLKAQNFTWTPVMTEAGACYVTNSLANYDVTIGKADSNVSHSSPIVCHYSSQVCYIMFEIINVTNFYIHSPYDVMDITTPASKVYLTLSRFTDLSVMESGCGKGVRELSSQRRGCLYNDEPMNKKTRVYSTNSCRYSCRSQLSIRLCGCRPFYYFYEEGPACSPAGMSCLAKYSQQLASIAGVRCVCNPQCLDIVFREIAIKDTIWDQGIFATRGSGRYTIQAPRSRYTREIVFHFQDLVVSFGGAAGLFLGASFISLVEIMYFGLERVFKKVFQKPEKKTHQVKKPRNSYEATRVLELTKILEENRGYELNTKIKVFKY
ncbi:pickpocket protein 28 [Manduca sexta]|uniref:pickpocket protein 28 n=1 Tax=Manduca sexta TaxID=7130 RepID=UPI0018907459|nr:pickpocket protein 28 [Manduca sexta]XP_037301161.1 pickpocket protein 28 [Manduca sexta]XP_037301162.1 pickpocket protein 28 [Manduca sexta]XP_037301164.1 pickpocket protein 28 [Manduca sexta]